jgi:hypothetical protein
MTGKNLAIKKILILLFYVSELFTNSNSNINILNTLELL